MKGTIVIIAGAAALAISLAARPVLAEPQLTVQNQKMIGYYAAATVDDAKCGTNITPIFLRIAWKSGYDPQDLVDWYGVVFDDYKRTYISKFETDPEGACREARKSELYIQQNEATIRYNAPTSYCRYWNYAQGWTMLPCR